MPLIHPFTHTFTHQRRLAAMQGTNQLVRSNLGLGVLPPLLPQESRPVCCTLLMLGGHGLNNYAASTQFCHLSEKLPNYGDEMALYLVFGVVAKLMSWKTGWCH